MNRERKYRAWHTVAKVMIYGTPAEVFKWVEEGQPIEVMDFVNLKDRNGKEIYEGDILCFVTQKKYGFQEDGKKVILKPVEFGKFCYGNNVLGDFIGFHIAGGSIQYKLSFSCEIIGNIYQTPQLLKQ